MPKHHTLNIELTVYELFLLEDALQDHAGDLQHDAQIAQVLQSSTDRAQMLATRAKEACELQAKLENLKRVHYG